MDKIIKLFIKLDLVFMIKLRNEVLVMINYIKNYK